MLTLDLTPNQISSLLNCLRVAAERFELDAKEIAATPMPSHARMRLVAQFEAQAKEAREFFCLIEDRAS